MSYIQSIEYGQYIQSQNTPPYTAKHTANQHEPTQTLPPPTPLVTSPPHFNIPPLSYASTLPTLPRLQNTTTSPPLYSASIQYRIEVDPSSLSTPCSFPFFTDITLIEKHHSELASRPETTPQRHCCSASLSPNLFLTLAEPRYSIFNNSDQIHPIDHSRLGSSP